METTYVLTLNDVYHRRWRIGALICLFLAFAFGCVAYCHRDWKVSVDPVVSSFRSLSLLQVCYCKSYWEYHYEAFSGNGTYCKLPRYRYPRKDEPKKCKSSYLPHGGDEESLDDGIYACNRTVTDHYRHVREFIAPGSLKWAKKFYLTFLSIVGGNLFIWPLIFYLDEYDYLHKDKFLAVINLLAGASGFFALGIFIISGNTLRYVRSPTQTAFGMGLTYAILGVAAAIVSGVFFWISDPITEMWREMRFMAAEVDEEKKKYKKYLKYLKSLDAGAGEEKEDAGPKFYSPASSEDDSTTIVAAEEEEEKGRENSAELAAAREAARPKFYSLAPSTQASSVDDSTASSVHSSREMSYLSSPGHDTTASFECHPCFPRLRKNLSEDYTTASSGGYSCFPRLRKNSPGDDTTASSGGYPCSSHLRQNSSGDYTTASSGGYCCFPHLRMNSSDDETIASCGGYSCFETADE